MHYGTFGAEGWPIGSGMVESANKVVVEDRLKGAGMHWADTNVNPLVALRNAVCNDRWQERWQGIEHAQREPVRAKRRTQRAIRQQCRAVRQPIAARPVAADETMRTAPATPRIQSRHPWRYAWSVRRQRELANAV